MATTIRPRRVDPRSPFAVDLHELGRRPGSMQRMSRVVPAPGSLANEVIAVPPGSDIEVAISLESVMDGVYVTGTVSAHATGECVRCLDPMSADVVAPVQELYLYDAPDRSAADADDPDELPLVDGDHIDLEPASRDAIVTALPFQPVCGADCPGLCSRCGARLADEPGHAHDDIDPRWAALSALATTEAPHDDTEES